MTVVLGAAPESLEVLLTSGADWHVTLHGELDGQPYLWPAGTVVELELRLPSGMATWTASITGADITWSIPAVQVAAAAAQLVGLRAPARLLHTLDGARSLWAAGHVEATR